MTVQPFLFFCNSSAAFDFRAVCIGCPEDGTPEAESAQTVAQYVVSFLINIQAAQKVRGERKKFISFGGFLFIQITVDLSDGKILERWNGQCFFFSYPSLLTVLLNPTIAIE